MAGLDNLFKNLISSELERRGIAVQSTPLLQDSVVGETGTAIVQQDELPSDENFYSVPLPPESDEPQEADENNENIQVVESPPLEAPDSATFSIDQTLIQPTLTSDVASVSVVISLDDIAGADNYEVRWVTA